MFNDGEATSEDVEKSGTGTRLMQGFARQLSGKYSSELVDEGYLTSLTFPKTL